eukprot:353619-Chlamydomonas_euryale.AAC.2
MACARGRSGEQAAAGLDVVVKAIKILCECSCECHGDLGPNSSRARRSAQVERLPGLVRRYSMQHGVGRKNVGPSTPHDRRSIRAPKRSQTSYRPGLPPPPPRFASE